MKRKNMNRLFAGFLALALMLSTFVNDYNTIAAHAEDETTTEEAAPAPAEEAAPVEAAATPEAEPASEEPQAEAPAQVEAPAAVEAVDEALSTDTDLTADAAVAASEEAAAAASSTAAAPVAQTYTISYKVNDPAFGSVSIADEKYDPSSPNISGADVTPADGYRLVNWTTDDGNGGQTEVGKENHFKPENVTGDITYTANFEAVTATTEEAPVTKTVKITYAAGDGGTVSRTEESLDVNSKDSKVEGSTATANDGYDFVNWTDASGAEVSTDPTYAPSKDSLKNDSYSYTAHFNKKAKEVKEITISYTAGEGGKVDPSSQKIDLNDEAAKVDGSTATAADGYEFVNWTKDGSEVSTSATFAPAKGDLSADVTYTANFKKAAKEEKNVTVTYKAGEGGKVSVDTETVDLNKEDAAFKGATATADDGYDFVNWTETDKDGKVVSEKAEFIPEDVTKDVTFVANFKEKESEEITGSATYDGVTVNVDAPKGAFPAGTSLSISPVVSDSIDSAVQNAMGAQDLSGTVAFDITFRNADGNEIQPRAGYDVSVVFTVAGNSSIINDDSSKMQAFHMEDASSSAQAVSSAVDPSETQEIAVDATSFSIYVVGAASTPKTLTYVFHDKDNKEIAADKQIVKEGEILSEPAIPKVLGKVFDGWYTAKDGGEKFTSFGTVPEVSETKTINLYARYTDGVDVFYTDQNDSIIYTQTYKLNDKLDYSSVKFNVNADESITGWYTNDKTKPVLNGSAVTTEMTLHPIVEKGTWLTFDTDGGSYIAPEFVVAGGITTQPESPTKAGYNFSKWVNGLADFSFGNELTKDMTIKATYSAKNVSYTVVFWKQKVTDSKDIADSEKRYDYSESISRTGAVGDVVSPTNNDKNKSYTGFIYNSTNSISVTIAADGTTVLNVYYDRQKMTITFKDAVSTWHDGYYDRDGWYHYGDYTQSDLVIEGLYGSTLVSNGYTWPDGEWYYGTTQLTFLDAFINPKTNAAGSLTLKNLGGSGKVTYQHYKQNVGGAWPDTPSNQTTSGSRTWRFTNKYNGFTVAEYSVDGKDWKECSINVEVYVNNSLKVRYTRNSYSLNYYNYNAMATRVDTLQFEESMSAYGVGGSNYYSNPTLPDNLPSYYTFGGWYADPACTTAYNFSAAMPANNVTVYAKWSAPKFTVEFYADKTAVDVFHSEEVNAGNTVNSFTPPTSGDKTFAGWVKEDGTPFNDKRVQFPAACGVRNIYEEGGTI